MPFTEKFYTDAEMAQTPPAGTRVIFQGYSDGTVNGVKVLRYKDEDGKFGTVSLSEQDAAQLASLMQLKADTGLSNLTEDGEAKIKGVFTPPTSTDLNTVDAFNGFARFPSGMIMQWGESLIQNKETTFDIVFPVTFPNRCFTVVVGTKIGGNVAADSYGATDKLIQMVKATTSGATFFQQGFESNSNWIKGCWIAIGN